ncbi:MAG: Ribosomal RNA small subunit methyltransferase G [Myxococcota bacterium]|nr:Ribosomal RNA small subunit methyltransferase G [Myxococcota bacterium]
MSGGADAFSEQQVQAQLDDLDLESKTIQQLAAYLRLLYEWNGRINLTRIPPEQAADLHLRDSLAALPVLRKQTGLHRILDIGSGCGAPGIPLAIALPHSHFHLMDSVRKKCGALETIASELGLRNVDVHWTRIEPDEPHPLARLHWKAFDAVLSRATWPPATVLRTGLPLLGKGGVVIAWASANQREVMQGGGENPPAGVEYRSYQTRHGGERFLAIARKAAPAART